MRRMRLGRSGPEISRVVFGSMARGGGIDADRTRCLDAAIGAGITSIDTAPLYGFGATEEALGRDLAGRRDEVELLSKVGLRWDADHGDVLFDATLPGGERRVVRRDSRPEAIRKDVEESLRRLRTDRIDLCQIHQPDRQVPIAESLGALAELVAEGKVLGVGLSNFEDHELTVALRQDGDGGAPVTSHQIHYNLLERQAEGGLIASGLEAEIGHLAYSPLEAGALTERMLDPDGPSAGWRGRGPFHQVANADTIRAALTDTVAPVAARHAATVSQVCLAWLLDRPGIDAVIVGTSRPEQARQNAGADTLRLAPEESAAIDRRFAALGLDRGAGLGWSARGRRLARRLRGRAGRLLQRA